MTLHSDPAFYTDEILARMTDEQLSQLVSEAGMAAGNDERPVEERDAWQDVAGKADDELLHRRGKP